MSDQVSNSSTIFPSHTPTPTPSSGKMASQPPLDPMPSGEPLAHDDAAQNGSDEEHGGSASRRPPNAVKKSWWKSPFRGMVNDVRRRSPYYMSDWKDAWDYRVVPATVYMFFANVLPALAFSLDMFTKTDESYGVNEVLLSSVLGSVVFSVFAGQPLTIVGVTGPITVFNYTVFDLIGQRTDYFSFMCWIGIWSFIMHTALAVSNACNAIRYVTRFSCDTFGFYVAFIYLQKGIQVLTRQWVGENPDGSFYLSITVSLLMFGFAFLAGEIGNGPLFKRHVRLFLEDYGTPLAVIFFTGFVHIGKMRYIELLTLPTGVSFEPTDDRSWFVNFWNIPVGDVFLAVPFAIILTALFYFDHNVSSLMAQGTEFPLRKPAGFHWDIFLLGLTTLIAGFLGLPFPNGLIPQAPFHTSSLCVHNYHHHHHDESAQHTKIRKVSHVVEQRFSNLAQGLLTLVAMSPPLLKVLHLIPEAVLAGLFFVMGVQALLPEANGLTHKIVFLLRDKQLTSPADPLRKIRRRTTLYFTLLELFSFGVTFAITQTKAAIGFPIFIVILMPVRTYLLPKVFNKSELETLDGPAASEFTMESVGGIYVADEGCQTVDEETETRTGTAEKKSGEGAEGLVRRRPGSGGEKGEGDGDGEKRGEMVGASNQTL